MNIEKSISYFLASLEHMQLSAHTLKAYKQDLGQWYKQLDKEQLNELGFEDFQDYLMYLQAAELKPATLSRKRVVIHRFLKYCYDKKLTNERLHDFIDPIKMRKHKKPKEVLTQQEISLIYQYIEDEKNTNFSALGKSNHYDYLYYCWVRNRLIVTILLYTGCRAAEVVALKKQSISLENNTITLLAKGHKYNVVPLHEELVSAFARYQEELAHLCESEIITIINESDYLFPSRYKSDQCLSTRTLHDLMLKFSEVLDRHLHAHLFRHTFASYCIAANMDISTISSLISHSNPSITLSIYTHEIEANQKQKEIKKLNFDILNHE